MGTLQPLKRKYFSGNLRTRDMAIDVESGTVNTLRVRAFTCESPPLSTIPAIVIISYCSPGWSRKFTSLNGIFLYHKSIISYILPTNC